MPKLPPDFTDDEWEALSNRERADVWSDVIRGLYKGLWKIVHGTSFSSERYRSAVSAIKAAAEARANCLRSGKRRR